jgi:hypothetical protein
MVVDVTVPEDGEPPSASMSISDSLRGHTEWEIHIDAVRSCLPVGTADAPVKYNDVEQQEAGSNDCAMHTLL